MAENNEKSIFTDRLDYLLYKNKMNKSELARRLQVALSTVYRWFYENRTPDYQVMYEIAEIFDVDVDWLYGMTDDPTPQPPINYDLMETKKEDELDEELVRLMQGLTPAQVQRVKDFVSGLKG